MTEPQLVDYIKKARAAGQADDQTRALLYKNSWTSAEVSEAFSDIDKPQSKPQLQQPQQPQAQPKPQQPQQVQQNKPQAQPQAQPAGRPQYQSQTARANMPRTGGGAGLFLAKFFIVLIILVVLAGAGFYVAGQYFNIPWNPVDYVLNLFMVSPQSVVDKMINSMKNVKSWHMTTQGELDVSSNGTSQGKAIISVAGDIDKTDANNQKSALTLSAEATSAGEFVPMFSFNVTMVGIGDDVYVKLNNLTVPNMKSGVDLSQAKGKFLQLDQESIKKIYEAQGLTTPLPSASQIESLKTAPNLFLSKDLLVFDKNLGQETVNGAEAHHYLLKISKDKLKQVFINAVKATGQNSSIQESFNSAFSSLADTIGDIGVEVWIGKKDYLLYKLKIEKSFDLFKSAVGGAQLAFKLEENNSKFNEPINIQRPQSSQPLSEVMAPALKVQKIRSDFNQIASVAELLFMGKNSYASLCSHNLMNGYLENYGSRLVELNNDIVAQGGAKPACFASVSSFCVSTQISAGASVCVGKNFSIGTAKCLSAATECK